MKILKRSGTFEVINEHEFGQREVYRNDGMLDTIDDIVIWKIARVARTCYQSEEFATEEKDLALVRNLLKRKHYAMVEFGGDLIVRFSNVSRGFTHEMVRHRLCSFAQESTRYVDESDLHAIVPPHKDENLTIPIKKKNSTVYYTLKEWLSLNEKMYRGLRESGWKPEDARQVLPIATRSQIVVKANLREFMHIFDMRCSRFAHWEIRGVMLKLLSWCQKNIPLIYDDYKWTLHGNEGYKDYAERNVS